MQIRVLRQSVSPDGRSLTLTAAIRPSDPPSAPGEADLAEERSLSLLIRLYHGLLPLPESLSTDDWDELEHAAALSVAVKKATQLLSCGTAAPARLCEKLVARGISRQIAEEAVSHLIESNLLHPADDARREVELCLRKYWGRRKIEAHLRQRGYGGPALRQAQALLDETDFSALCAALIARKYRGWLVAGAVDPQDDARPTSRTFGASTGALGARSDADKLRAALSRYGFTPAEIRAGIKDAMEDAEDAGDAAGETF